MRKLIFNILESEGIPAVIHGIKMIDPVIPGNVRVRINEADLPKALRIIEKVDFTSQVSVTGARASAKRSSCR